MKHAFISDVHLGAFSPKKNRALETDLISFINFCTEKKIHLHVLGDLFDYWMEYPDYIPELGQDVLESFREYNQSFKSATFITGNHDNWTRGYFKDLGFNVTGEYVHLEIEKFKVLLHHGDGLSERDFDLPRPFFHRILRHKFFISLFQSLFPASTGIQIMKSFSSFTRRENYTYPARLSKWSKTFLNKNPFDVVICGHDHVPRMETFSFGTYINLGTFFEHKTLALYTKGQFKLVVWDGLSNTLKPINTFYPDSSFV